MDMLLLFLLACSSTDSVAKVENSFVPTAPAAKTVDTSPQCALSDTPTLEEIQCLTAEYHRVLGERMQIIADTAVTYDATTGAKAQEISAAFQKLVPAVLIGFDENWVPQYDGHTCPPGSNEVHFVTAYMNGDRMNLSDSPAGVWNANAKLLAVRPDIAPDEAYLPYTAFHEGYHMLDPQTVGIDDLDYNNLEEPAPREDAAIAFESRLINAYSKGRYDQLVTGWAEGVRQGVFPSIAAHGFIVAEPPADFRTIMTKNGKIYSVTPSVFFQVMSYDLNRVLTEKSDLTEGQRASEASQRYKRMFAALNTPNAVQLVGYSLGDWLR